VLTRETIERVMNRRQTACGLKDALYKAFTTFHKR
jgi:hypothetical protein